MTWQQSLKFEISAKIYQLQWQKGAKAWELKA